MKAEDAYRLKDVWTSKNIDESKINLEKQWNKNLFSIEDLLWECSTDKCKYLSAQSSN